MHPIKKYKKNLPIGISTLEKMIHGNHVYVDKTHYVAQMATTRGGYFFLSRPRRFGKSLFVDTLKQAFLGRQDLFKGLYLEKNWDWTKKYPVIHFDFGIGAMKSAEDLEIKINQFLDYYYEKYDIPNKYEDVSGRFNYLLSQIEKKYTHVVVLIDEYDKPILDNITSVETAKKIREVLKNLYSVLKGNDANLKFVMLTGVSKFSKVNLFSGLNNLSDITIDSEYADICGYTQHELEENFEEYLTYGKVNKEKLKLWYNGYSFGDKDEHTVYNPFDILLFCSKNYEYSNYWFETGTPTFLLQLIEKNNYFIPNLEKIIVTSDLLSTFDIENIDIITLLFQAGYLTISKKITIADEVAYKLYYPNREVKASLNNYISTHLGNSTNKNECRTKIYYALLKSDFTALKNIFTSHFAGIPNDWYRKNKIGGYEGFYASVVYSYFAALGYNLIAEDVTNHGKIDLTLIMPDKIVIIEFKLKKYGNAQDAMNQIINRKYAEKYKNKNLPIYLLAIVFDNEDKNVTEIASDKIL